MGIKWKKAEKQLLKEKLAQGLTLESVMLPGRNSDGIRRQALKLKLTPRLRNPGLTRAQKKKIKQLRAEGLSAKQISELDLLGSPHRTAHAVQKYFGKLRLAGKNRSLAGKNKKVWREGEKKEFDDFLRQYSATLAPQQIAEKFGVKKNTVLSRQRFLGVKTPLAQTLAIPYFKERAKKAAQQRRRKTLLDFDRHIAGREKNLMALAEKIRQKKYILPKEEKRCKECGKHWLKHPKFFFHKTKSISIGPVCRLSAWHFAQICVICIAKQRHQKRVAEYQQEYSQKLE